MIIMDFLNPRAVENNELNSSAFEIFKKDLFRIHIKTNLSVFWIAYGIFLLSIYKVAKIFTNILKLIKYIISG